MAKTVIFWPWWQPLNSFSFEILFFPLFRSFLFATQKSRGWGVRGGGGGACAWPWPFLTHCWLKICFYSSKGAKRSSWWALGSWCWWYLMTQFCEKLGRYFISHFHTEIIQLPMHVSLKKNWLLYFFHVLIFFIYFQCELTF